MEIITSRKNPTIMRAASLSEKKYRDRERQFLFSGRKLFCEALQCGAVLSEIFVTEKYYSENRSDFADLDEKTRIIVCSQSVFEKLSEEKSPEGILCCAKYLDKAHNFTTIYKREDFESSGKDESVFVLCGIRDPGNLGTVIRTAAAFGIDELIVSDCADIYNPKTVRGAMGALFRQRITVVSDQLSIISGLRERGYHVLAAALTPNAVPLDGISGDAGKVCYAVGNEGHGLDAEFIAACDGTVIIPMAPGSESLNAAVAASILMFSIGRNISRES